MTQTFCPKCYSEDIKIESLTPPRRQSMDSLAKRTRPLVHYVQRMRATCGKCGYTVEYER